MKSYKDDPDGFKESMKLVSSNFCFVEWVISAIDTKEKINYCDEMPRYVLKDAVIDGQILTFVFDNDIKNIDFSKVTVNQCSSAENKFELTGSTERDYKIIIFNC